MHNFAAYLPGMIQIGDMDRLVADMAPKPFLMTHGSADELFPVEGIRQIDRAARDAYAAVGASEAYRLVTFEGGHSLPNHVKEVAYAWLDRWLR